MARLETYIAYYNSQFDTSLTLENRGSIGLAAVLGKSMELSFEC